MPGPHLLYTVHTKDLTTDPPRKPSGPIHLFYAERVEIARVTRIHSGAILSPHSSFRAKDTLLLNLHPSRGLRHRATQPHPVRPGFPSPLLRLGCAECRVPSPLLHGKLCLFHSGGKRLEPRVEITSRAGSRWAQSVSPLLPSILACPVHGRGRYRSAPREGCGFQSCLPGSEPPVTEGVDAQGSWLPLREAEASVAAGALRFLPPRKGWESKRPPLTCTALHHLPPLCFYPQDPHLPLTTSYLATAPVTLSVLLLRVSRVAFLIEPHKDRDWTCFSP